MAKSLILFGVAAFIVALIAGCASAPAATEVPPVSSPSALTPLRQSTSIVLPPVAVQSPVTPAPTVQALPATLPPAAPPPAIVPSPAAATPVTGCGRLPAAVRVLPGERGSSDNPLVIAFEPYRDVDRTVAAANWLAECLSQMTGLAYKAIVGANAAAAVTAMGAGKAQIGFLDTPSILQGRAKYQLDSGLVILRTIKDKQEPYYQRQFVAARASGISSLGDLRGKTFCFGEPDTSFGNTVPRIVLAANGINPDKDLRAARFAGFADQVAVAVYRRECDAGVTYVDVLTDPASALSKSFPDILDKVGVFYVTEQIPNDGVQYVKDLDPRITQLTSEALLALAPIGSAKREPLVHLYKIESFMRIPNSFYLAFEATVQKAGVDPTTLVR